MEKYQTMEVIMLATKKPSPLLYSSRFNSFCIQGDEGMWINDGKVNGASFWTLEKAENNSFYPQDIYVISDGRIEIGDWYYTGMRTTEYGVHQCATERLYDLVNKEPECRKIEACTYSLEEVPGIDKPFLNDYVKSGGTIKSVNTLMTPLNNWFGVQWVKAVREDKSLIFKY